MLLLTPTSTHRMHHTKHPGDVNLPRLAEIFAGIPGTFVDPPYLFFHQGNVDPDNKQHNIQHPAEQVKQMLDLASPELTAAVGGWRVIQCPDDDGMSRLHANLLIARFAGAEPDASFLRVYVGSANCSVERGVAFGTVPKPASRVLCFPPSSISMTTTI